MDTDEHLPLLKDEPSLRQNFSDVGFKNSGKKPTISQLFFYGALAFPLAFVGLPIYLHAPDFYAVELQQSVASLGAVLLTLRLIDALQDPVIGSLSDRFHHQRGAILALGATMLGAGFWMLFHPLTDHILIWFGASILICTTGFSIVSINFQSLGGLWQAESSERTRITAHREAYGLIGLLVAAIAPFILFEFTDRRTAFSWLTYVYIPVLALAFWMLLRWKTHAPISDPASQTNSAIHKWWLLLSDRWRLTFFCLLALNVFASSIPATLVIFFIRDRLGAEELTGLFLLIYFLAGTASMPVWTRLANKFGKLRAWQLSLVVAIFTFFWATLLQQGDVTAYAVVCALSGLALGADLALPPSILADHIEADQRQNEASRLFSVMAFLSKSSLAFATGITLPLLGAFGYVPNTTMSGELNVVFSLTYAGIPCILKLFALLGLIYFDKELRLNKSFA